MGTLHLYVPSPSRDYWGDLQRVRGGDPDAAAGENPLLRAWGAAGRDFMAVLGNYEVVHPDLEIRVYLDQQEYISASGEAFQTQEVEDCLAAATRRAGSQGASSPVRSRWCFRRILRSIRTTC